MILIFVAEDVTAYFSHPYASLCVKTRSGKRMLTALLVVGILALVIAGLVIFSAMQDMNDDY